MFLIILLAYVLGIYSVESILDIIRGITFSCIYIYIFIYIYIVSLFVALYISIVVFVYIVE